MTQIHSEIINDIPILKVTGRVAADDSLNFINQFKKLGEHEALKIVLDLQETTFLDSAAIGTICAVHIDQNKKGKKLEIMIDPSHDDFIQTLFETTGLNDILNIIKIH